MPTIAFLIWLAFHLYAELLDIQNQLGAKRADCAQVEDQKSTCVLQIATDHSAATCVFRSDKLKPPPP